MPKPDEPILLSWTQYVPVSEGQDPLGLNLRVNARLAGQLFYCITSITPRARYYAFIPWAISVADKLGVSTPLRQRLRNIEKAFGASCVAAHQGSACDGGRLVGTDNLVAWFGKQDGADVGFSDVPFAKIPAFNAYVASLANLGLFESEDEAVEPDSEDEASEVLFSELKLSERGLHIASCYQRAVEAVNPLGSVLMESLPSIEALVKWGEVGCLCGLHNESADMAVLHDIFFNKVNAQSRSHEWRRNTLLLILCLADQFADAGQPLSHINFGRAVFFGAVPDASGLQVQVDVPSPLADVAARWRMFYFHFYLSAALENLLVCVVRESNDKRMDGFRLEELLAPLGSDTFNRAFREMLGVDYKGAWLNLSPAELLLAAGVDISSVNVTEPGACYRLLPMGHPLCEDSLHELLAQKQRYGTPEAIALAGLLCVVSCWRYLPNDGTPVGNWFAKSVNDDPYLNVTTPVVAKDLGQPFRNFMQAPFNELLMYIIQRYIIRLHQSLAYLKSGSFFYVDEDRIYGRGKRYDVPGYGNGRFASGIQILRDLGLLCGVEHDEKTMRRTSEGQELYTQELQRTP